MDDLSPPQFWKGCPHEASKMAINATVSEWRLLLSHPWGNKLDSGVDKDIITVFDCCVSDWVNIRHLMPESWSIYFSNKNCCFYDIILNLFFLFNFSSQTLVYLYLLNLPWKLKLNSGITPIVNMQNGTKISSIIDDTSQKHLRIQQLHRL